jgi:multiple sugar transport system substrate-binding protein
MLTKSKYLVLLTVLTMLAVTAGGAGFAAVPTAQAAEPVTLSLVAWTYDIEKVQDNINKFMEANPDIKIELKDISWYNYHDTLVAQFTANAGPDVMYVADQWLPEWAEAGWLVSLEKYFPDMVAKYRPLFPPYVEEGMGYNGEIYGLPYYSDTFVFIYDETKLKAAGFDAPPTTWEDLSQMAATMKEKGICDYPIVLPFNQNEVKLTEIFYAMAYSRGDNVMFFDQDMNPLFNQEGHPAIPALKWLADGIASGIIDPNSMNLEEIPAIKSIQADTHAFAFMEKYTVAEVNGPESGVAGKWKLAMMPGSSHATVGGARFYSMTSKAVERGDDVIQAAGKFLEYFGGAPDGQYTVTKRWAIENGLGFGITELYNDPDIVAAFGKWGDVPLMLEQDKLARFKDGQKAPWYGPWAQFMRTQVNQAMAGRVDAQGALDAMVQQWTSLKTLYQ